MARRRFGVDGDLKGVGEGVGLVGEGEDREEFGVLLAGEAAGRAAAVWEWMQ